MSSDRAAQLKQSFDEGFALAPNDTREETRDLLAIRVGAGAFAFHLPDVRGLFADKPITTLPTPIPELLGVASFRGGLVPVYDLRALLGYESAAGLRWMILVAYGERLVGLAFDVFEGHRRVPPVAIAAARADPSRHVREVMKTESDARAIVDVVSVLKAIESRAVKAVRRER